jgi:hypothetical protein
MGYRDRRGFAEREPRRAGIGLTLISQTGHWRHDRVVNVTSTPRHPDTDGSIEPREPFSWETSNQQSSSQPSIRRSPSAMQRRRAHLLGSVSARGLLVRTEASTSQRSDEQILIKEVEHLGDVIIGEYEFATRINQHVGIETSLCHGRLHGGNGHR